ncbi:MAG: DUF421 domain-containing protein [Bacilli bacterium]|nr:DUF421 domain-containing protein [Bacilli bacterium]
MEVLIVLGRTLLFYLIITVVYRFMGKREVGELSIMDLIVSILIAELAAMAIDKYKSNLLITIVPILSLVIVQIIVAKVSLKSPKTREKIEGEPSVIINRGKVNFEEMLKQRYNLDDLLTQLREKSIKSIEEVDYAILETSGKLSVFVKNDNRDYPLPVILDGEVQEETLIQIGKNKKWLIKSLDENQTKIDKVFYAFYKNHDLFIIKNENVSK